MNGATAEPCVSKISPPRRNITTIIGINQNFFRAFKNSRNSTKKDIIVDVSHSWLVG
jgi:hypothetical protein